MEGTKVYRVKVTNTGATLTCEGVLVHTVPDHGIFDRHLALALDHLKRVEKRQWLVLKTPPQVGIQTPKTSVLEKEYLIITEPVPD